MKRNLINNPETLLSILAALSLTACGKDIGSKFSYTEAPQPVAEISKPTADTAAKVDQTKMPLETVVPESNNATSTAPTTETVAEDNTDDTADLVAILTSSENSGEASTSGETSKKDEIKSAEELKKAETAKAAKEAEDAIKSISDLANTSIMSKVVTDGKIDGTALKNTEVQNSIKTTIESLSKLSQIAEDANVKKATSINLYNLGVLKALSESTNLFDIGDNEAIAKKIDSAPQSEGNTKSLKDLETELMKQDSRSILVLNKGKEGGTLLDKLLDGSTVEATLTSSTANLLKLYIKKGSVDSEGKFKVIVSALFENATDLQKVAKDAGISEELTSLLSSSENIQYFTFNYILITK